MNCHNCGKNIWPEFNECPYCKADAHSEIDNEAVEIEEDEDSSVLELGMSSPVGIDDESPIQSDDFYSDDYDLNSLGKIIKARALMLFDSNKNGWEKIIEEEIKAPLERHRENSQQQVRSAHFWIGNGEDEEEAINYIRQAIELDPNNLNAFLYGGEIFYDLEKYGKAIIWYNRAIALDPNFGPVWTKMGNCNSYLATDNEGLLSAIKNYDKAIEIDANIVNTNEVCRIAVASHNFLNETYRGRGLTYAKLLQYERAIRDYDKAIELDPKDKLAYRYRGDAYRDSGRLRKSESDYRKSDSF